MKVTMVVLKLLFLGALFIVSNQNLALSDGNDRIEFLENYSGWMDSLFQQGIEITAYVMKSEWLPKNAFPPDLEG